MKAVILAGGLGSRLSEETTTRPKPMVEIGGLPILIHIMKYYFSYGVDEFIICCGYKGYFIKEYFSNYFLHNSDVTFDMKKNEMQEIASLIKQVVIDKKDPKKLLSKVKSFRKDYQKVKFCFDNKLGAYEYVKLR